jgi:general secretion pathway protein H
MSTPGPVAGKPARRKAAGFTLVELLIVFTLLVTLTAVLAPILMPSPSRALRESASEVATTLRETRRQAQASQARRRFLVNTDAGQFGIEGSQPWRALPEDMKVALTTGRSLLTGNTTGGIDFFPDGSSTGGRVSLSMADRSLRVDIEWLTGRVRVNEDAP